MAEKDRVRTEQFRFTLLPEENAMLTKNAFEYGLSKADYLRKLILAEALTGKQWHMDRDQAKQLIYEVNRIGNNVNQIAYNTNAVRSHQGQGFATLFAPFRYHQNLDRPDRLEKRHLHGREHSRQRFRRGYLTTNRRRFQRDPIHQNHSTRRSKQRYIQNQISRHRSLSVVSVKPV